MIAYIFRNRKLNREKLLSFGFVPEGEQYVYSANVADGQMQLTVKITANGEVTTQMIDCATGEEYVLHRVPGAAGAFVGRIKAEYEAVLQKISEECFEPDVFKTEEAKIIISYVRVKYGDELEFLWEKFPDNAIWRRKDTNKWYAAILTVSARKLGLDSDERLEILDLRLPPELMDGTLDHQRFFPGYHMNKKHWYTIILNGSVSVEEICRRIDESYCLAKK